jgi:hypothetical protein
VEEVKFKISIPSSLPSFSSIWSIGKRKEKGMGERDLLTLLQGYNFRRLNGREWGIVLSITSQFGRG